MVKSREKETLVDDLKETFDNLRTYKMMLNPDKCVFGVPAGKLLGFLVSTGELRLIQRRLQPSPPWPIRSVSMVFNG